MIYFEKIEKIYGKGNSRTTALAGVTAAIGKGDIVALCGPSGSGKSTLLNICGLLDVNFTGAVSIDGQKLTRDLHALTKIRRNKVGFIFQNYNLIPVMTAYENVEYPLILSNIPAKERQQRVVGILEKVGLEGHEKKRPDQLSGGQQQRVAVARALVKRPGLIIADEPTANLDTKTANLVIELMKSLGKDSGTTFLIATHDERMSGQCDRVIRMQDGEIIESDDLGMLVENETKHQVVSNLQHGSLEGVRNAMD